MDHDLRVLKGVFVSGQFLNAIGQLDVLYISITSKTAVSRKGQ